MKNGRKKIAIVGSGVSGLSALYALRNTDHEVHLYEAAERLGGHTNTVDWTWNGKTTKVDTGFIVMNTATYPNFIAFLKEIGITPVKTEMTFGVCRDRGAFEWSGTNLNSVFAQRKNLFSPRFWRMIFDIIRFNQFALDLLVHEDSAEGSFKEQSIGDYLEKEGYSEAFKDDYLIPMTACVWSTGADKCALEFPATTLVRFLWNHHLLNTVAKRPDWMTIPGGSKRYIDAVMQSLPTSREHLSTPVSSVRSNPDGRVLLTTENGTEDVFDHVILACHGDEAMRIISYSATAVERKILSAFQTTPNVAYLHADLSLMPTRPTAWSAWNYLTSTTTLPSSQTTTTSTQSHLSSVCLTYNMNILQHIPAPTYSHVLVTMNPPTPPNPLLTQRRFSYAHPLYTAAAVRAQDRLPEIQGSRGVWYAGAWTRYGFHEDGFTSGLEVALRLGGSVGWEIVDARFSRGRTPRLTWRDYALRVGIICVQLVLMVLEWIGGLLGVGGPREKMLKRE